MAERKPQRRSGGAGTNGRASLSDAAYVEVRTDILRCVLEPGRQLTEQELAERYGYGKAPIRTALTRLRHERLVESTPRRGWAVAPITLRDVRELFQIRLILEPPAARLAAGRLDEAHLHEFETAVQRGYSPGDPASQASFLEANRRFHLTVAEASGNHRLADVINQVLEEVGRVLHLGLAMDDYGDRFQHEHQDLIQALVAGDGDAAEQLTHDAIRGGEEMALEAVLNTTTVVAPPQRKGKSAPVRARQKRN